MAHFTLDMLMVPEGKGASAMHMRLIQDNLHERYVQNIHNSIRAEAYRIKGGYAYHIYVPSESNAKYGRDIFYDVIFEFYPATQEEATTATTIKNFAIKAFSNSPSFTFTFTNTLATSGILPLHVAKSLFSKRALKERAKIRNPLDMVGIDKTIWYAGYYLLHSGMLNRRQLDTAELLGTIGADKLTKGVLSQDDKLVEIDRRKSWFQTKVKADEAKARKVAGAKAPPERKKKDEAKTETGDVLNKPKSENVLSKPMLASNLKTDKLKSPIKTNKLQSKLKSDVLKKKK